MENCRFCNLLRDKAFKYVLLEDEYAIAFLPEKPFREGNCTIAVKRHLNSISELTEDENKSVFRMVSKISGALELNYSAEKTYLISISDKVKHLHYHLIPKLEGQVSMGVYSFIKLQEEEGVLEPSEKKLNSIADILRGLLGGKTI